MYRLFHEEGIELSELFRDCNGRVGVKPSMVFYQKLDSAGCCVLDSLYPRVSRFQSLGINGIVVCPEGIKFESGVAHRCEFLCPLAKLFGRDALVIPSVRVDPDAVPEAAPNQLVYRSAEMPPDNVPARDIERAQRGCRFEGYREVEVMLVPFVNVQFHVQRIPSLVHSADLV